MNYLLSNEAENDLYRIWQRGLHEYGKPQADKYFNGFIAQFEKITEQPLMYQAVDDIRSGYRRCVFCKHSIFYRVSGNTIEIMALVKSENRLATP